MDTFNWKGSNWKWHGYLGSTRKIIITVLIIYKICKSGSRIEVKYKSVSNIEVKS